MMISCSIDLETYSSADISKTGAYGYAEAPDFQILLLAYCFDYEYTPTVIDLSGFDDYSEAVEFIEENYNDLFKAIDDPRVTKTAFNANFERTCLARYFGEMPPEQWHCTMVRAAQLGLPMSLASVGEALGLAEDKQKLASGKALIQYFCKPCKPTKANGGRTRNLPKHAPEKWELFKEYNRRDVEAEMEILARLKEIAPFDAEEHELWCFDQRLNDHGVLLDMPYIRRIIDHDKNRVEAQKTEAARLTGLSNPNSVAQLKTWLEGYGVELEGVTKATVAEALKEDLPDKVRRVLELRQMLGKTSVKKYEAMQTAVCKDGRLRGILQFCGAGRTGRWAGRIVQVHNLPQNHIENIELCRQLVSEGDFDSVEAVWGETAFILSQLIRTAFIAPEGKHFVVCDFSAVEARILGWLADEKWRMRVFAQGGDIYCESASKMFKVPVEKHGQNSHLRQRGKVAELALGYQGGVGAMKAMDTTGTIPVDEMQGIVDQWREASPSIVKLWRKMELAARRAIDQKPGLHQAISVIKGLKFYMNRGVLFMVLPSGRRLAYWGAKVETMADGREHITYKSQNQTTKKWETAETYGGKLVENAVQAIGRDCLAEAMLRVAERGYRIVMHIHDEMVVEVPDSDMSAYGDISKEMGKSPEWAEGLVLRGDGYETKFYKKD